MKWTHNFLLTSILAAVVSLHFAAAAVPHVPEKIPTPAELTKAVERLESIAARLEKTRTTVIKTDDGELVITSETESGNVKQTSTQRMTIGK